MGDLRDDERTYGMGHDGERLCCVLRFGKLRGMDGAAVVGVVVGSGGGGRYCAEISWGRLRHWCTWWGGDVAPGGKLQLRGGA